jgi:two-component system, chemotaxis family, protein-glutamate methylesterase/glutaminase
MMNSLQTGRRIKVLIIDDSALVRTMLTRILGADPGIEVVGTAPDAFVAREKIKLLNPDVLTLDVEMPRMDGLQFLRNLMRLRPMPVVMCSSLTQRGADVTLAALELGAVDFVAKPKIDVEHAFEQYSHELVSKLHMAASARVRTLGATASRPMVGTATVRAVLEQRYRTTEQIIAIGASTGGTEAIRMILEAMPANAPGIVITQHIPRAFSAQFAARMDSMSQMSVKEAEDGDLVQTGHAYVAPGDQHLVVVRDGARYRCRLSNDAPLNHHRPSVDVMFESVAAHVGRNAVGVLLTGMGADGARGLLSMREHGAYTLAQDEHSSVVWGMPGAAVALGAVERVLPIEEMASALLHAHQMREERHAAGS